MLKTSKKRDVFIWSAFVLVGLLLFANGIFEVVRIEGFDSKFWAFVFLSGCAVFSCYFANTRKSAYVIYAGAAVLQALLTTDLYLANAVLRAAIGVLSVAMAIFLIVKYIHSEATNIIEKKRLSVPAFVQINKFNLFANMICVVGLLALLFDISEKALYRVIVAVLICLISLALTYIKQRYKRAAFGRKLNIAEYAFVAFWLIVTLINAIFLTYGSLGYTALVIIILMTDYFIFDRPLVIEKFVSLSEQE